RETLKAPGESELTLLFGRAPSLPQPHTPVTRGLYRSGLAGLIGLLALLGFGQFLLDFVQVPGVELRTHLAERALGLLQVQGASVEVDADQAHSSKPNTTAGM